MIPFVILLLSATSALGADYTPYNDENQQLPMDYFDDIYNRDMNIKPDSMFSYNFEQTRRDQPPQIEMREENVGRYFHARPTTTTPSSIFSMNAERESQHVYPNMSPRNDFNSNSFNRNEFNRNDNNRNDNNRNDMNRQSWNEPQKSTVPPPPRFAFPRQQVKPQAEIPHEVESSQYHHQPMMLVHQNDYRHGMNARHFQPHPSQVQTTAQPAMQWTENYHVPSHNMFVPTQAPQVPQYAKESEPSFAPSASFVSDSMTENKHQYQHNMPRGHHKFNWNDMKTDHEEVAPFANHRVSLPQAPTTVQPSTVHAMNDNKAPPPVPTLSPWYDGFGK